MVWKISCDQISQVTKLHCPERVLIASLALESELSPDECLQLLEPIYGLDDSRDQWNEILDEHLKN